MKKIVIKTVDGKIKRMTAEEYNKRCVQREPIGHDKEDIPGPPGANYAFTFYKPIYRTYPNRFAGKRAHET